MNQSTRIPVPQNPPQARKTVPLPFFSVGRGHESLFSVREGIPLGEALEAASYLLSEAQEVASTAEQLNDYQAAQCIGASVHLMELAHAALDSAFASVEKEAVTGEEEVCS